MELVNGLNAALWYIEENLEGEIDFAEAAKRACLPEYQFLRLFLWMTDCTLTQYIRRRRLSKAAEALQTTDIKIVDLAFTYGYESPTAFNRAFTQLHGIAPSKVQRHSGAITRVYPPISFKITIQGAEIMQYKLVNNQAFRAVGYKLETSTKGDRQLQEIPAFWAESQQNGKIKQLEALCSGQDQTAQNAGLLGICTMREKQDGGFLLDYYIAIASDQKRLPEGMCAVTVPECTYAVFSCKGPMPDAIQQLTKRIYTEWLPASGFEWTPAPDIERYPYGDTRAQDYECEVWLPVKKA